MSEGERGESVGRASDACSHLTCARDSARTERWLREWWLMAARPGLCNDAACNPGTQEGGARSTGEAVVA